ASRLIGSGTPSEALRAYDAAAAAAVQAHQGIVHRTGESSLIAVWDAAGERASVEHALEFSLALREAAKRFNDEVETRGDCPGALSVCVHAGDCTDESFELTARIASFGPEVSADILVTGPALTKAPRWFTTEKLSPGDDGTPELHELLGRAKQAPDSAAAA
ncbi:MAG: hypothetical protein NDJ90_06860, partial [Oligoflexia bacterium]|nr:hypothetical protein [Oligoflexia bacterium]